MGRPKKQAASDNNAGDIGKNLDIKQLAKMISAERTEKHRKAAEARKAEAQARREAEAQAKKRAEEAKRARELAEEEAKRKAAEKAKRNAERAAEQAKIEREKKGNAMVSAYGLLGTLRESLNEVKKFHAESDFAIPCFELYGDEIEKFDSALKDIIESVNEEIVKLA